jgi:hypothetical protein
MPRLAGVAQAHLQVMGDAQQRPGVVRKVQFAIINMSQNSGNKLLVTECERSVQDRHRNSAGNDG